MVTCSELPLTHSVPQWMIYFCYFQEKMFCCSQSHGACRHEGSEEFESWWYLLLCMSHVWLSTVYWCVCTATRISHQPYCIWCLLLRPAQGMSVTGIHMAAANTWRDNHTILPSSSSSNSRDLWCGCLKNKQHWQGWLNWDTPELLNQSQYLPCHPSPPTSQQPADSSQQTALTSHHRTSIVGC